jgi:uncharacterized membrane protein YhiD involved in acid resistance
MITLSAEEILTRLGCAFLLSLVILLLYRTTPGGTSRNPQMILGLILCPLVVSMIMMAIDQSLARAFGLLGALSIIRFRTPIRDLQDILFLFFAIALGIVSGVGAYRIALVAIPAIASIGYLSLSWTIWPGRRDHLLRVTVNSPEGTGDNTMADLETVLARFCRRRRMSEVSSLDLDHLEILYETRLDDPAAGPRMLQSLRALPKVKEAVLLSPVRRSPME